MRIIPYRSRTWHTPKITKAGSGLGQDQRRTRPAVVLDPDRVLGKPAAFDITVTSPLNPSPQAIASLYGRLSLTLVRANVRAMLSRSVSLNNIVCFKSNCSVCTEPFIYASHLIIHTDMFVCSKNRYQRT